MEERRGRGQRGEEIEEKRAEEWRNRGGKSGGMAEWRRAP